MHCLKTNHYDIAGGEVSSISYDSGHLQTEHKCTCELIIVYKEFKLILKNADTTYNKGIKFE